MTETRSLSVVVAAGGSAGHVEPALSVAALLRDRGHRVSFLGTAQGLEAKLVPERGFPLATVPKVPLPRRVRPELLSVPFRLGKALLTARRALRAVRADVVLGVGGYVSVPAYLSARSLRIPIVIHEANPVPGIANRIGARLTKHVAVSVEGTPLRHGVLTGLPLRPEIIKLDRGQRAPDARRELGLPVQGPVLLVTGGSQGARRLNDAVTAAADELHREGIAVLHITGHSNAVSVRESLGVVRDDYVVLAYAADIATCYAAADLIMCRAGAVTCAEVAAVGIPAVFVPLPIGNGEQARNAASAVEAGAAVLVEDADLDRAWISSHIPALLGDARTLARMSAAACARSSPDAAALVADMVESAARETGPS